MNELIYRPPSDHPWARSHAALPFALPLDAERARVYFSTRDDAGRSQVAACTLDLGTRQVSDLCQEPLLKPGPLGAFDDSGCTVSSLVRVGELVYLYYTGWSLGRSVPFYLFAGLALSTDGGRSFERFAASPLLPRSPEDPYLTASPFVMRDGARWRMWYVSAAGWRQVGGAPQHRYHIRHAESADGIHWERDGHVCVDFADPSEYAFGRPSVVKQGDRFRMWFCVRGDSYRLGYAESSDGLEWERDDAAVAKLIEPAVDGWDSDMQAYPHVFEAGGRWHMLYNGNGYGRTGFGVKTWA